MPDDMKIDIEVNLDVEKAVRKINTIRREINRALTDFERMSKKLEKDYYVFDKITGAFGSTVDMAIFKEELSKIENQYKRLSKQVRETKSELSRWYGELGKLLRGEPTNVSGKEIEKNIENIIKKIDRYNSKLEEVKRKRERLFKEYEVKRLSPEDMKDTITVEEIKRSFGTFAKVESANRQLKTAYDTLRSTKATRMDKNLQLFTASIFEGIMSAFDDHLSRAMGGREGKITEVEIGRRLAGMAIRPEQFYMALMDVLFEGSFEEKFGQFAKFVGRRYGEEVTFADVIRNKKGEVTGINIGVDPLTVIRDLIASGGELGLSGQLRTGLMQGLITNVGIQFSSLSAKIGIIGVILNKIYEVLQKMVTFSGVMKASLQLLTLITQLSLKPVADIIGSMLLPMLIVILKALMPIIRNWNKIFGAWMRTTKEKPELNVLQLLTTLIGLWQGNIGGAFAGAVAPMMLGYTATGENTALRALTGAISVPLMTKMLTGGAFDFGKLKPSLELFGKSVVSAGKEVATFGKALVLSKVAVAQSALGLSTSFSTLALGVAGIIGAFSLLGYSLIKFSEGVTKRLQEQGIYDEWLETNVKALSELGSPGIYLPEEGNKMSYEEIVGKRWEAMEKYYPSESNYQKLEKIAGESDVTKFDELITQFDTLDAQMEETSTGIGLSIPNISEKGNDIVKYTSKFLSTLLTPLVGATQYVDENAGGIELKTKNFVNNTIDFVVSPTQHVNENADDIETETKDFVSNTIGFVRGANEIVKQGREDLSATEGEVSRYEMSYEIMKMLEEAGVKLPLSGIPPYQSGGWVEETGLALVHEGEYVVPRNKAFELLDVLRNKIGLWKHIEPVEPLPIKVPIISGVVGGGVAPHVARPVEQTVNIDVSVNVDHISSDIDIDRIAEEVGRRIYREMVRYGG